MKALNPQSEFIFASSEALNMFPDLQESHTITVIIKASKPQECMHTAKQSDTVINRLWAGLCGQLNFVPQSLFIQKDSVYRQVYCS